MRKHYDFATAQKNPYARRLKRSVTLRLDQGTLDYFRELAVESTIPYQTLINMYLRDCAVRGKRLRLEWRLTPKPASRLNGRRGTSPRPT